MMIRESTKVATEVATKVVAKATAPLVQEHREEAVSEHLKELYEDELQRVLGDLKQLLPRYRADVSRRLYGREKAELEQLRAHLSADSLSLHKLEASLSYLLKKQLSWTDALRRGARARPNQNFQLQYRASRTVKAYKQMTRAQAERLNVLLAAEDSDYRWSPLTDSPSAA